MADGIRVYRADAGSCNGCDIEVLASLDPKYGLQDLNVTVVEHPEEANVLLVTGMVTKKTESAIKEVYAKIQQPKLVIAYGQCAVGMDVFYDSYNVVGAIDAVIPVNLYIPGCPPSPRASLYGITKALGVEGFKEGDAIWNVSKAFRGKLAVDEEKCIGCGACAEVCPAKAIDFEKTQDKTTLRFWHSKCIQCGSCREVCPPEAITMTEDYKLATDDKQKIYLITFTKGLQKCANCGRDFAPTQISSFGLEKALAKISKYEQYKKRLVEAASYCPECRKTIDRTKEGKRLLLELNQSSLSRP